MPTLRLGTPTPLPIRSLFDPLWERGILIEAAGSGRAEGDLNLLAAIKLIARGQALRELPAERIQSMSKGCQLLIDAGLGMQPFANDARQIVGAIRKAVGTGHTTTFTFVDCPST